MWNSYNLPGKVKFSDWESVQARVESKYPYLRVAQSGRWTVSVGIKRLWEIETLRSELNRPVRLVDVILNILQDRG